MTMDLVGPGFIVAIVILVCLIARLAVLSRRVKKLKSMLYGPEGKEDAKEDAFEPFDHTGDGGA